MADEKQLQNHLRLLRANPNCIFPGPDSLPIEPSFFSSAVGKGHPHPYSQATSWSSLPGMEGWDTVCKGVMVDGEGVYGVKVPPGKMD